MFSIVMWCTSHILNLKFQILTMKAALQQPEILDFCMQLIFAQLPDASRFRPCPDFLTKDGEVDVKFLADIKSQYNIDQLCESKIGKDLKELIQFAIQSMPLKLSHSSRQLNKSVVHIYKVNHPPDVEAKFVQIG